MILSLIVPAAMLWYAHKLTRAHERQTLHRPPPLIHVKKMKR